MTGDLSGGRLTARGEAGLAVFRLFGRRASEVLQEIFAPRGAAPLCPGQVRVGRIVDGDRVLDDAVVRIRAGESGWDAEISIHGGLWIGDRLLELLAEAGAEPLAEHECWTGGRSPGIVAGDRFVAEAREGLLAAFAEAQVRFFLDAADGGLSRAIASLERSLAAATDPGAREAVADRIDALLRRAPLGLAMAGPPAVMITGVPNSGKSTLFNALLGEARAIVSPEAGTTRDLVDEPAAIGGFPFRLLDSAGIRGSADTVERLGVARAEAARAAADIVVALIDPAADLEAQATLAESVVPRGRRIVAVSKADLPGAAPSRRSVRLAALDAQPVSAKTGEGLAALRDRILAASAFGGTSSVRQAAPFLPRHVEVLAAARDRLGRGLR